MLLMVVTWDVSQPSKFNTVSFEQPANMPDSEVALVVFQCDTANVVSFEQLLNMASK